MTDPRAGQPASIHFAKVTFSGIRLPIDVRVDGRLAGQIFKLNGDYFYRDDKNSLRAHRFESMRECKIYLNQFLQWKQP